MTRSGDQAWTLVVAGIFAYALMAIAVEPLGINGDSALHIEAAERILDGGLPHVDAIDTNPPLIMFLTAVPTAAARLLNVHPIPVFLVSVLLLSAVAAFAARRLLLEALPAREAIHAHLLGVALAVAACVLLFRNEFGQREHLFVFGVLPYLMVRFRSWEGIATARAAAVACGLAAGIAASIKPQLALIVIAPEIYWAITRRTLRAIFRTEVVAAVSAAMAYLAYLVVVPAQREAFFGVWVPLLMHGFAAFNASYESLVLLHFADWRPAAVAMLPFVLRARPADTAWRLAQPLAVATATAAAVYLLQRKGWTYHAAPIRVLACVLVGLIAAQLLTPAADVLSPSPLTATIPGRVLKLAFSGAIALAVVISLIAIGSGVPAHQDRITADSSIAQRITAHTNPGDPVLVLSTNGWDPFPLLVQLQRRQASRALFAFPVSLLYYGSTSDGPSLYPREERMFLEGLQEDVLTRRPRIVLIDSVTPCYGCPDGMSLTSYFERTGFIDTALAGYERASNVDRYQVYLPVNGQ